MLSDVLIFTSLTFLIPLNKYYEKQNKNDFENIIAILLLINLLSSLIHWSSGDSKSGPIRYTVTHKVDMEVTKILLVLMPVYILFYKENVVYCTKEKVVVLLVLGVLLYHMSNKESFKDYQTSNHIVPHVLFHIVALIGATIAFS